MPREFHRSKRVAQAIHRALAERLMMETREPALREVTLTHVEVSRDLGVAKVYYTHRDPEDRAEIKEALRARVGDLRHEVSRQVRLRATPQLRFLYDESIERGQRLTSLIEDARSRDGDAPDDNSDDSPDDKFESTDH